MKGLLEVLLFSISFVHATNFQVRLGVGGLIYNPNTVTAVAGDTIEFLVTGVPFHLIPYKTNVHSNTILLKHPLMVPVLI